MRAWHIAALAGLAVGAGGMYAGLAMAGRIHSFPRHGYLRRDMDQPVHLVFGDILAYQLSASKGRGWQVQSVVRTEDGRNLVCGVADMRVELARGAVVVILALRPRFVGDAATTPPAEEAWRELPADTRTAAVEHIRTRIAAQVAQYMNADRSAIQVVVPREAST